ncbi:Similar to Hmcn1: Hemicentin-1 (Mus musculus), partial [Cotesia congregata]
SQPTTRFINELFFVGEYIYTSELTIKNVSDEDVGEYKCYFYGSSVPQIAKANLQLHAKKYLNVTMKSLKGLDGIKKELGRSLGQYIPIYAYPYPTIKWLDPKGNEIHNDWKPWNHHFNGEYIVVRLSKNNLTLDDEGNHTLIISNPAKTVTHSFFVTIITKPKIINQPKSIPFNEVLQNFSVSADCEAEGKPVPRISWNYTNNLYNMEKNSPEDSVKITSTADGVNKIKSEIEVNVQKTGKLICKACNEAGCVSSVAKIINVPVSMKVGPGVPTTFRSISLTVGDPLTIECKSSKNMTFFSPEFNKKVVTSKENLKDTMVNNGPIVKFELRQTVYRDSGWYGCANLPMKYFTPAQTTDHLFIEDPFLYQDSKGKYYVNGEVGKDVLLPCRPSSPNYQVKLYSAGKVIDAEFDPIKGMMIKNLTANSPIDYACVIQLDNGLKKSMDFEIEKPDRPNDLEKPKIVTRSLNNTIIGGTIEIDCTVSVWSNNDYILTWVMPLK